MKISPPRSTCSQRQQSAKRMAMVVTVIMLLSSGLGAQSDRPPWARKSKTAGGSTTSGEISPDPLQDRAKIKVNVDLVSVLVSVLDEHNRPAPDLPAEAFHLFDEDNPQTIAVFEKETQQPLD